MARTNSPPQRSNLGQLLDSTLFKAISVLAGVAIFCATLGYQVGIREEISDHNLAMIKAVSECSEKINAEIDKRRAAEDAVTGSKVTTIEKGVSKLDSVQHEKN
jgi:hypothetical protein